VGVWRHVGVGLGDGDGQALIGREDVRTPPWAQVFETMASSGAMQMLRMAPVAWGLVVRLAWQTSRGLTMLAAVIELVAGCVTALSAITLTAAQPNPAPAGNGAFARQLSPPDRMDHD